MKKALMITSVASMIKQFNLTNIQILQNLGYEVTVATNFQEPGTIPVCESKKLYNDLKNKNVIPINLNFHRTPFNINNIKAYKSLKELVNTNHYNLIHCQSPVGGALTRIVTKKSRKKGTKVIYTAHGFHFYKGAPLLNWLTFYPVEKWLSKYTDALITINKEDYNRSFSLHADKNYYVPGVGVDLKEKRSVNIDNQIKREELGISKESIVITSVGELNSNKNHQIVIKSLQQIKNNDFKYLVCGKGSEISKLKKMTEELNLEDKVHFLGYRDDIIDILYMSDIYVFPSHREGLSVSLMEAMSCKLPIVASNIRGNEDLVDHNKGGYLVAKDDINQYTAYIIKLLQSSKLRNDFGRHNYDKIESFSASNVNKIMKSIYKHT